MKISKKNLIRIEELVKSFAKSEGITPMAVAKAINCLHKNELNSLTEYDAALLYDAIGSSERDLSSNSEILSTYLEIEGVWAVKAKNNGTKMSKELHSKTLH